MSYTQEIYDKIKGQLVAQRDALGLTYSGSMDSDWLLNDMTQRLANSGLSSIYDFDMREVVDPLWERPYIHKWSPSDAEGNSIGDTKYGIYGGDDAYTYYPTEEAALDATRSRHTGYFNKADEVRGELTFGGAKGKGIWASTGAGEGYTDYHVQEVTLADGSTIPVFLTQKMESGGLADFAPILGIVAMAVPGLQGIGASLLSGTALAGSTIAAGALTGAIVSGSIATVTGGDILESAAIGALGGAVGGYMRGETSLNTLTSQSADLIAAGFDVQDVADSLAGLGNAADINGILQGAGVGTQAAIDASYNTLNTQINVSPATSPSTPGQPGVNGTSSEVAVTPEVTGAAPITEAAPATPSDQTLAEGRTAWANAGDPDYVIGDQVAADLHNAGVPLPPEYGYGDAFMPTDAAGVGFNGEYNIPFDKNGVLERDVVVGQVGGGSNGYTPATPLEDYGLSEDYFRNLQNTGTVSGNLSGVVDPTNVLEVPANFTDNILGDMVLGTHDPLQPVISASSAVLPGDGYTDNSFDYENSSPSAQAATTGAGVTLGDIVSGARDIATGVSAVGAIIGSGGGGGAGTGGGSSTNTGVNYTNIMSQLDPYWTYRRDTEIPMMEEAGAGANALSSLYRSSFSNPLGTYNLPEMQALSARFMGDIQRRDAATGRMSQYGARGVEAQNQYLTNTLPAYRQNLQQGLGTLYNAAKVPAPDAETVRQAFGSAIDQSNRATLANQGTLSGAVSGLQGSWNQMTGSNNVLDQITGAANTISNVANVYNTGTRAWNTLSNMFQ